MHRFMKIGLFGFVLLGAMTGCAAAPDTEEATNGDSASANDPGGEEETAVSQGELQVCSTVCEAVANGGCALLEAKFHVVACTIAVVAGAEYACGKWCRVMSEDSCTRINPNNRTCPPWGPKGPPRCIPKSRRC